MLYDVKPDESLTGGAWYSDQEFESEFIEVLNQHCFKFLQQKVSLLVLYIFCEGWFGILVYHRMKP